MYAKVKKSGSVFLRGKLLQQYAALEETGVL